MSRIIVQFIEDAKSSCCPHEPNSLERILLMRTVRVLKMFRDVLHFKAMDDNTPQRRDAILLERIV